MASSVLERKWGLIWVCKASKAAFLYLISERREDDRLVISIQDNGKGLSDSKLIELKLKLEHYGLDNHETGIGLLNVHERIRLLYGEPYGLDIQGNHSGTEVRITIPAKRIEVE